LRRVILWGGDQFNKGLLADIQAPLGKLSVNSLKPFRDHVRKVDNDLKNYIKMVIEESHSMGG
jgi:hypothetical protein